MWNPLKYYDSVVGFHEAVDHHCPNKQYETNSPLPGITTVINEVPLAFSTVQ